MKASKLIEKLQEIIDDQGDMEVCSTESHEYWGTIYKSINIVKYTPNAQPDGPKRETREAIVLEDF
jgi:hypothetical protein